MKKKTIAFILSLMIIPVFFPVLSFADGNDISSGYSVLLDEDTFTYTGSEIKPKTLVVVDDEFWCGENEDFHTYENYLSDKWGDDWRDKYTLSASDYSVKYPDDCINTGEKTITVTGKGSYTGSITKSYYITPKELEITRTKNADKSVTLTVSGSTDLTGADIWFYNEDYHLKSGEFSVSGDSVTISADFLEGYISETLNHRVRVSAGSFYGNSTVRSYNISGLPCLGNIKKVYNGKQKTLTSSDIGMNNAKLGKEYKVVYGKSKRRAIGRYTYTIKGKGDYIGSMKGSFEIIPKSPSKITSAKKTGTKATVKWKKVSNCSGYQVQLIRYSSRESDMPDYVVYKKATIKGKNNKSKTFRNVKKSKYTKVRIRSYKTVAGKKIYSNWKYRQF